MGDIVFEVLFPDPFSRELKKLEKKDCERIKEKLKEAAISPFHYFEKLEGFNLYRIRIGKFRVIASINFQQKQITCISVGLRKNIYRNLKET